MFRQEVWTYTAKGEEPIGDLAQRFGVQTNVLLTANPHLEDLVTADDGELIIVPPDKVNASANTTARVHIPPTLIKMSSHEIAIRLLQLQQGIEKK